MTESKEFWRDKKFLICSAVWENAEFGCFRMREAILEGDNDTSIQHPQKIR